MEHVQQQLSAVSPWLRNSLFSAKAGERRDLFLGRGPRRSQESKQFQTHGLLCGLGSHLGYIVAPRVDLFFISVSFVWPQNRQGYKKSK